MLRTALASHLAIGLLATVASAQTLLGDFSPGTNSYALRRLTGMSVHGPGILLAIDDVYSGEEPWWSDGTPAGTRMLKDIAVSFADSNPGRGTTLGNAVLFFAKEASWALWRTDGTTAGTTRVGGPFVPASGDPPVVVGNHAWFLAAISYAAPQSLWRTDGTAAGTTAVVGGFANCGGLTRVGSRLFFHEGGRDLWTSDGTAAGTLYLHTFVHASHLDPIAPPADLNGLALFAVDDGAGSRDLWASDGTVAGTALLMPPTTFVGVADEVVVFQGRAYFSADDGVSGYELWSTDGTVAGTSLVVDLAPGPGDSFPHGMFTAPSLGRVLFSAGDWPYPGPSTRELHATDGTAAGTHVIDLGPGGNAGDPNNFADAGGMVVFRAYDAATGAEPWVTFGTTALTWQLGDLRPGTASSSPRSLATFGNEVVFLANDGNDPNRLWATDGTVANTRPLLPPWPREPWSSGPNLLANVGSAMWLGLGGAAHGGEVWASNGTPATTRHLLSPIGPSGAVPYEATAFRGAIVASTLVYPGNRPLVRIDASGTATVLAAFSSPYARPPTWLRSTDDLVFFSAATQTSGYEPWCSDGTVAGTRMIADLNPQVGSLMNVHRDLVLAFGNRFVFVADDGVHGLEPWITDGTAAGTFLLADIWPGTTSSGAGSFCDMGDYVLFSATDGVRGVELWRTDGTTAGTYLLADIAPQPGYFSNSSPADITRVGDHAYFAATLLNDRELWRTDGTTAGTVQVFDLPNGELAPDQLVAARGRIFFRGYVPGDDRDLWVSDGTAAGTLRLSDIRPEGVGTGLDQLSAAGSAHVVFAGNDPDTGSEVWISDGTVAGTVPLAEVEPGPGSSQPWGFVQAGGYVYWRAVRSDIGSEPFAVSLAAFGGAMWEPYGDGCGGVNGRPVAEVVGTPILGSTDMAWTLRRAANNSVCFLLLSLGRDDLRLVNDCRLFVGDTVPFVSVTNGLGVASLPMPIPNDPGLVGLHLYAQFAVVEPGGPLAGLGTASQGVHVLIGR